MLNDIYEKSAVIDEDLNDVGIAKYGGNRKAIRKARSVGFATNLD